MADGKRVRLSVLDQSPVPEGSTPADALKNSIELAKHVERLGYHRYWMSEHHAMELLACTAPEVLLARIGAETSRIRIGSGGIMLPHYSAYKVAEVFRTLHALYPGRVDLGIGRAPGGGPLEAHALRRERRQRSADDFTDQLAELLMFLNHDFPAEHPFSQLTVSPEMPGGPEVWLLGSSMWSAEAAAQFGLPYSFAHFFSPVHTRAAIEHYTESFRASGHAAHPRKSVADWRAVCGDRRGSGAADGEPTAVDAAHSKRRSASGAATGRCSTRIAKTGAGADGGGRVAALLLRNAGARACAAYGVCRRARSG